MKTKTLPSIVAAAALAMSASCGVAYRTQADGSIWKIDRRLFAPDDDYVVCPAAQQPVLSRGETPAESAAYLAEQQRFAKERSRYLACVEEVSAIDPNVSIDVVVEQEKVLDRQDLWLGKKEDHAQTEQYAVRMEQMNDKLLDTLKEGNRADVTVETIVKPMTNITPETTVNPGTTVAPYAQSPAQPSNPAEVTTDYTHGQAIPVRSGWVQQESSEDYLSRDQQRRICNNETPEGLSIQHLGSMEFPECGFGVEDDHQVIGWLVGMAQDNSLVGKTALFCGNADRYLAEKCPSKNNLDLSGHRAVNMLNALVKKASESTLAPTHADIYANGTALDQRSVHVYVVGEMKNES